MKKVINLLPNRQEYCLLIKSAFDTSFCDKIINTTKSNFKKAITHYPTSYRNNERQVIDDETYSTSLFNEIKNYIPNNIKYSGISKKESGEWILKALNSRIRVCRYLPNQYFNKHLDGVHYISDDMQSKLTFMIYLNGKEDFSGGKTLFFDTKNSIHPFKKYTPEKGDLIIFDHNLWHSGEIVLDGIKYVLRSDIIYQKINSSITRKEIPFSEGHLGYIWNITKFNDNLITSGRDKKIKVWSNKGEKRTEIAEHKNSILKVIVLNKNTIVSASRDATINILKLHQNDSFELFNKIKHHKSTILSLCKIDDSSFFSADAEGIVNQIDVNGKLIKSLKAHKEWIWDIKIIDESFFITISETGSLKVWSCDSFKLISEWKYLEPLNSLTIKENIIYVGTFNGYLIKLQFDYKKLIISELYKEKIHSGIIRRIKIHKSYLLTASEDNFLKIHNLATLKTVQSYDHKNFVQDLEVLDDKIISVSYEGEIHQFQLPIQDTIS
ncbi:2OG-Fe(II) oxygenase [uncultured Tenacibaculum sp.]|uniref:2OG-Fe(II) oxygenase n=1 Tax=uncultured Tenacibaculum sp. TaxID=174713 RepID=UPI00262CE599|nr:2OG-Fe(II) oxygenase [uncultured Tenacibaculum sp.]